MKKDNKKKTTTEKNKSIFDMQSVKLSKEQKVWIGIASIILAVLLLLLAVFCLNNVVFEDNRHFTISAVKIDTQGKSASYWNNPQTIEKRSAELTREMEIEPGKDNLFAQDLGEKRADLLKGHPEMEDIQLIPILPDLLQIRIKERLPVARLDKDVKDDAKLIDKNRILFAAKYCGHAKTLPFIKDETSSEELVMGKQVEGDGIKFLLEFINLLAGNEFQFQVVSAGIVEDKVHGKSIKAHLKRGGFECENVFFYYPQDGAVERLKANFKVLKDYAERYPLVNGGNLLVTTEVTKG